MGASLTLIVTTLRAGIMLSGYLGRELTLNKKKKFGA